MNSIMMVIFALSVISSNLLSRSHVLFRGFKPTTKGVGPTPVNQPSAEDPFRYFQIYLPDGYFAQGNKKKRYPVYYFLHGFGQNYSSYSGMFDLLDKEIASGQLAPMIVVKPDASISDGYLGSFYTNSSLNGDFESYIVHELRTYVNQHFRTCTGRKSTGIAGHAMGGYGAFLLAIKHPEVYGSVVAHSPSTLIAIAPQAFKPSFYDDVLHEIPTKGRSAGKVLPTNGVASYQLFVWSAALSPNKSNKPFELDLPIKIHGDFTPVITNGKLTPDKAVLKRWLKNDPFTLVNKSKMVQKNLKTQNLYIDFGKREKVVDTRGAELFEKLLQELGIPHTFKLCKCTSFPQKGIRSPSNDIAESLVAPVVEKVAHLLQPDPLLEPKVLVDLTTDALKANKAEFSSTALSNISPFLTFACNLTAPATIGDLLIDPAFLSCLAANNIKPKKWISEFFDVPGFISIDPPTFGIDTDGFKGVKPTPKTPAFFCPAELFLSIKK